MIREERVLDERRRIEKVICYQKWIRLVKKGVPILMGTPFSFRENLVGKRSFSSPGGEQIVPLMELSAKMSVP